MYCPQCSQQQLSEEMRFCSRCGFALGGVRDLVVSATKIAKPERPPALRGAKQAAWILLGGFGLTTLVGLLTALEEDFAVLLILPFVCFLIGFVRLLYAVFIQDWKSSKEKNDQPAIYWARQNEIVGGHPELPPRQSIPVDTFTKHGKKTAEVVHPPSVTENTTTLLDETER